MISHVNYSELLYSLVPPVFALLVIACSKGENRYFDNQSIKICQNEKIDQRLAPLLSLIAKSSIALNNHIVSILSGFISIIITFHIWPRKYQFPGSLLIIILFLIFFRTWIWRIFSLDLYEYAEKKVPNPRKKTFHDYTYAELFTRQQVWFNVSLIVVILLGHLLK